MRESGHRVEIAGALALQPRPADRQRQDQRDRQHAPQRGAADPVRGDVPHQADRRADDEHADRRARRTRARCAGATVEKRGHVGQRVPAEHVALERDEGEQAHRQGQRLGRPDAPGVAGVEGQQRGADQREVEGGDERGPARATRCPGPTRTRIRPARRRRARGRPRRAPGASASPSRRCEPPPAPGPTPLSSKPSAVPAFIESPARPEADQGGDAEEPADQHDEADDGHDRAQHLRDQDRGRSAIGQP